MIEPAVHARRGRLHTAGGAAFIAGIVTILYLPALHGPFILDDDFLTQNRLIKAPDGLYRLWLTTEAADYWPLTNSSFWLEWRLWKTNPTGYHVTNLVLHIIDSLLLWAVLKKLAIPGAFLAALLFAIHPVNVESVAWIAQRKNVLAMLFFLLSIFSYLNANGPPFRANNREQKINRSRYWLSFSAFVLAMLCKGSVAILPIVLLLIAWWQRNRIDKTDLLRTAPFFLVAILLTAVNLWFRGHGAESAIRDATFIDRLLGAGAVVWFYLSKAVWPVHLLYIYPQWNIHPADPRWWLPLLAAVGMSGWLWRSRRTPWGRALLFAWLYYCVCLLPVMGFADVGFMLYSLVADHYQHLALVAVAVIAAAGLALLRHQSQKYANIFATAAAAAVIVIFSLFTLQQTKLYADPKVLYQGTLEGNPDCWLALNNLGQIEAAAGHADLAETLFQHALRINPNSSQAHYNIGVQFAAKGRTAEALSHYQQAQRLGLETAELYNNLGQLESKIGHSDQALAHYRRALELNPDSSQAHYNLAIQLAAESKPADAISHYRQALRLGLETADLYNNLALAEAELGDSDDAIAHYQRALEISPKLGQAHYNLAIELAAQGHLRDSISHYREALRIAPATVDLYNNLGIALAMSGQLDEAVHNFELAHRLEPDNLQASINLASGYAQLGRLAEAIALARQAQLQAKAQANNTLVEQIDEQLRQYKAQESKPAGPPGIPANSGRSENR